MRRRRRPSPFCPFPRSISNCAGRPFRQLRKRCHDVPRKPPFTLSYAPQSAVTAFRWRRFRPVSRSARTSCTETRRLSPHDEQGPLRKRNVPLGSLCSEIPNCRFSFGFRALAATPRNEQSPLRGFWSEREDLNLRPLVSQTGKYAISWTRCDILRRHLL